MGSFSAVLLFYQVFNSTSQNPGNTVQGFRAGLVDILLSLFVHLHGPQRNAGLLCERGLGTAVGFADTFQVGIPEMLSDHPVRDIRELGYVSLMKRI